MASDLDALGASSLNFNFGQMASAIDSKRSWKYTKKALELQHQYEQENLQSMSEYQKQLALEASSLRKESLKRAGYSTADPEGTGTVAPTVSMPSSSASGGISVPSHFNADYSQGISALANARLADSQTRLNEIESSYLAKKRGAEIENIRAKTKEVLDTLPTRIDNLIMDVNNKRKDLNLKDSQVKQFEESAKNLAQLTKGITIDNKYKDEINQKNIDQLTANIKKALAEGDLKRIEADLARDGILVGSNWLTQLVAIMHQGYGVGLLGDVTATITGMMAELPGAMGQIMTQFIESISEGISTLPEKLFDKLKGEIGKLFK